MSCDGRTLGKIIFGFSPRVVLPPQQPVSNARMEQVQRRGQATFWSGVQIPKIAKSQKSLIVFWLTDMDSNPVAWEWISGHAAESAPL